MNYELIKKYQYQSIIDNTKSSIKELPINIIASDTYNENAKQSFISDANIFHFYQSTMTSAILGNTGLELINSEKFDEQFEQISLCANKYNSSQYFILFNCPSLSEIQSHQKESALENLVFKVSSKVPFTFTLRCKYANETSIDNREAIYSHFRLLLEIPYYEIDEVDVSLLDYFLELQKKQILAESHLLLNIKAEHFSNLKWGQESYEHIYLKYFAVKTLERLGYSLSDINCEVQISPDEEDTGGQNSKKRRPDVYLENKIIVEVETLRGRGFSVDNIFCDLIYRVLAKSDGWTKKLESLWLVLPGFEIARNYYQVKKTKEILEYNLAKKYGNSFKILIMTPDYENHQLVPVCFKSVEYPSLTSASYRRARVLPPDAISKPSKPDFSDIKGLNEEKVKLRKLLQLQSKGYKDAIGGILFFGLPGCGKTLLANAFANESGRYFFQFSPADIQSVWLGQSQKNIRDIFAQAKKKAPSVLFIDELDSIGFNRNEIHAHTDQKATINQLLIELNNLRDSNVIVIAATNYFSGIDSALKRSGRLDWKIPIFPPDKFERAEMFKHYLQQINISYLIDILPVRRINSHKKLKISSLHDLPTKSINVKKGVNLELVNFEILGKASTKFTSSDIELVCREVRNAIILEEISSLLTTSDVITYLNNLKDGGLSLTQEQVKEFLDECKRLSVKNSKLETLRVEWEIE